MQPEHRRWIDIAIIVTAILANLIVRFAIFDTLSASAITHPDLLSYIALAENYLKGEVLTSEVEPGYGLLMLPFLLMIDQSSALQVMQVAMLLTSLIAIGGSVLGYWLTVRWTGSRIAGIFTLLILLFQHNLVHTTLQPEPGVTLGVFILMVVAALQKSVETQSSGWAILTGLLVGFAYLVRAEGSLLYPALVTFFVIYYRTWRLWRYRLFWQILLPALMIALLYFLYRMQYRAASPVPNDVVFLLKNPAGLKQLAEGFYATVQTASILAIYFTTPGLLLMGAGFYYLRDKLSISFFLAFVFWYYVALFPIAVGASDRYTGDQVYAATPFSLLDFLRYWHMLAFVGTVAIGCGFYFCLQLIRDSTFIYKNFVIAGFIGILLVNLAATAVATLYRVGNITTYAETLQTTASPVSVGSWMREHAPDEPVLILLPWTDTELMASSAYRNNGDFYVMAYTTARRYSNNSGGYTPSKVGELVLCRYWCGDPAFNENHINLEAAGQHIREMKTESLDLRYILYSEESVRFLSEAGYQRLTRFKILQTWTDAAGEPVYLASVPDA